MTTPILLTDDEYTRLMHEEEKLHEWMGKRTSYREEELPKHVHSISNEARSLCEVYYFIKWPPERYFAYVNREEQQITTWAGDVLGTIAHFGYPYRSNMGDMRQSVRFHAINGKVYAGTYYKSAGDYCRLKQVKA